MSNIIEVAFDGATSITIDETVYQYDYGQQIHFSDIDLDEYFEVHFSNDRRGKANTVIGHDGYVEIPNRLLRTGLPVHGWLYFHETESDGETEYYFRLPIVRRANPVDEATPEQESTISMAIAALQEALDTVEDRCDEAVEESTSDAEAWARGTRSGTPVDSDDEAYHNNSKYYSEQSASYASVSDTARGLAVDAKIDAETAQTKAEQAADRAEQGAATAGYMNFYINDAGHLIYQRTANIGIDFYLENGHLFVTRAE